mmetsp:Transcript_12294/g.51435  ORF Transcript_12294/g.51435 Transcript_12294/m.51435 type:complete len:478 (+) Transcript_12294:295-1728(+)
MSSLPTRPIPDPRRRRVGFHSTRALLLLRPRTTARDPARGPARTTVRKPLQNENATSRLSLSRRPLPRPGRDPNPNRTLFFCRRQTTRRPLRRPLRHPLRRRRSTPCCPLILKQRPPEARPRNPPYLVKPTPLHVRRRRFVDDVHVLRDGQIHLFAVRAADCPRAQHRRAPRAVEHDTTRAAESRRGRSTRRVANRRPRRPTPFRNRTRVFVVVDVRVERAATSQRVEPKRALRRHEIGDVSSSRRRSRRRRVVPRADARVVGESPQTEESAHGHPDGVRGVRGDGVDGRRVLWGKAAGLETRGFVLGATSDVLAGVFFSVFSSVFSVRFARALRHAFVFFHRQRRRGRGDQRPARLGGFVRADGLVDEAFHQDAEERVQRDGNRLERVFVDDVDVVRHRSRLRNRRGRVSYDARIFLRLIRRRVFDREPMHRPEPRPRRREPVFVTLRRQRRAIYLVYPKRLRTSRLQQPGFCGFR